MAEVYTISGYDGDSEGEGNAAASKNKRTGRWTKEEVSCYPLFADSVGQCRKREHSEGVTIARLIFLLLFYVRMMH